MTYIAYYAIFLPVKINYKVNSNLKKIKNNKNVAYLPRFRKKIELITDYQNCHL